MGNVKGGMTKNVAEIVRHFKSSKTPSGTIALFAGPAGSGKSMAAKALATEIGLDIYRIDLGAVVNKYIGETEKNLARVLETAETKDVILLFDEADALFGQRTEVRDAHDRYANIDANYLLQRIEQYSGLVILATNNKKQLDPVLLRRARFVIEFPRKS
jgi:SpoVK/Ycf46/Vps4 family AAA+-type ATPase